MMRRGEELMRDQRRRLEGLEYLHLRRVLAKMGQPYIITVDAILDYARVVYALPEAEQRELFHDFYATLTAAEIEELDVIKRQHIAIFRRVR
jgi:hypothetical protein